MSKLRMLSGLPGSGKTTLARELVESSGNAGRINRDDLRAMLFNSKWSGPREGIVIECEKVIARVLLEHNLVALVDDTNLQAKHLQIWSNFAKSVEARFETEILKTPLAECVRRDSQREKPVGEAIINRMALFAGMIDFGTAPIEIFDLDGTLCDGSHRDHHLEGGRKDWRTYFSKMGDDLPVEWVIGHARDAYHSQGRTVCMVSGRPDTYQHETIAWLKKHNVPYHYLFMRPGGSKNPDTEVKQSILDHMPKEQIIHVWDDRPSVIRMWRSNGLTVTAVRGEDLAEF